MSERVAYEECAGLRVSHGGWRSDAGRATVSDHVRLDRRLRLVDGVSCFLLGGRAWAVTRIEHDRRRLVVETAPRGKKTTWGGCLPQFLGRDVCQKILSVLTSDETYNYLAPSAQAFGPADFERPVGFPSPPRDGFGFLGR